MITIIINVINNINIITIIIIIVVIIIIIIIIIISPLGAVRSVGAAQVNSLRFVIFCCKRARVAASCYMLPSFAMFCPQLPLPFHYGESRHFCDDPAADGTRRWARRR